jgi:phage terminase small subunit
LIALWAFSVTNSDQSVINRACLMSRRRSPAGAFFIIGSGASVTAKHKIFIREYLIDLNATQAALRAGYKKSYARRACFVLLRKPAVAAAVAEGMAARARRTDIDADRVMREYAKLAFCDIRRLATWGKDGVELRPHTEITEDDAAAIVELSRTGKSQGARIKIHDKRAALDALARHLGVFAKDDGPHGRDLRTGAETRARAALKARIEKIIAERDSDPEDTAETKTEGG